MLGIRRWHGVQIDLFLGEQAEFVCDAMVVEGAPDQIGLVTDQLKEPATSSAARWLIHAAGPVWKGGNEGEAEQLACAYHSSLAVAEDLGARHVGFSSLATMTYNYPTSAAALTAMQAFKHYLDVNGHRSSKSIMRLTVILSTREDYRLYQDALFTTFPDEI